MTTNPKTRPIQQLKEQFERGMDEAKSAIFGLSEHVEHVEGDVLRNTEDIDLLKQRLQEYEDNQ